MIQSRRRLRLELRMLPSYPRRFAMLAPVNRALFLAPIAGIVLAFILAASFAAHGLAQTCPTSTPLSSGPSVVASADPSYTALRPDSAAGPSWACVHPTVRT